MLASSQPMQGLMLADRLQLWPALARRPHSARLGGGVGSDMHAGLSLMCCVLLFLSYFWTQSLHGLCKRASQSSILWWARTTTLRKHCTAGGAGQGGTEASKTTTTTSTAGVDISCIRVLGRPIACRNLTSLGVAELLTWLCMSSAGQHACARGTCFVSLQRCSSPTSKFAMFLRCA